MAMPDVRPKVTLVVAMSLDGVIGREGRLPWRLPADLRQFKADTLGKPVLMGRKTFESIGRALPGRHNIVLTRHPETLPLKDQSTVAAAATETRLTVVSDWQAAVQAAGTVQDIMVIGGAEIYAMALPHADRILLTRVEALIEGDTRFPRLDPKDWQETVREHRPADDENPYPIRFLSLTRRASVRD
jgi:dihydrofolate reductase